MILAPSEKEHVMKWHSPCCFLFHKQIRKLQKTFKRKGVTNDTFKKIRNRISFCNHML